MQHSNVKLIDSEAESQALQTAHNDMVTPVPDEFDEKDIDHNISYDNNNINNKTMKSNIKIIF